MLLSELKAVLPLKHIAGPEAESFDSVYAGDLLSRAMSHVGKDNLWITIMSNVNVIAVASLSEASAVLLAEDVNLMPEAREAAEEQGIPVYSTPETVYTICARISSLEGGRS